MTYDLDSHNDVCDITSMGVPQSFAHMKRIAVSAGLVALGASVAYADGPSSSLNSMEASKVWSVAATLRGWYDSNYTLSDDAEDSWGFTVAPSVSINLPLDQTLISASYTYSLLYYDASDKTDQMHQFDLSVLHAFSERYLLEVRDQFVVAQEPEIIDGGTTERTDGNNYRNTFNTRLNIDLTRLVSLVLGYGNNWVHYEQDDGTAADPSRAGLLDRFDNTFNIDVRWQAARQSVAVVGYQFGMVNYTGDEDIAENTVDGFMYESDDRNSYSHYLYAGVDQVFNPKLTGSMRLGVQYADYYNNEPDSTDSWGPYCESSLSYTYTAGGAARFGVRHARNATDVVAPDSDGEITMDQASTTIFGDLTHQLTPKLRGSLLGSLQFSEFNGGDANDDIDTFYGVGVNLTYTFTQHFSAECGYNYDGLRSDIDGREYDRNRVYIGFTAAY